MSLKIKKKVCNNSCCVVNCKSRYGEAEPVSFYSFPYRPWEEKRRQTWISSVRRLTVHNNSWKPTKYSKICSKHFSGGKKSEDPRHVAYNPTIFPPIYKVKSLKDSGRTARLVARIEKKNSNVPLVSRTSIASGSAAPDDLFNFIGERNCEFMEGLTKEIGIQTDFLVELREESSTALYCSMNPVTNDAETQTNIFVATRAKRDDSIKVVIEYRTPNVKRKDAIVGPDGPSNSGFYGFEDIKNDVALKQLTGVSRIFFMTILQFIKPKTEHQPSYFRSLNAENRLLLFFMRMKLGLKFTALACIFKISHTTASSIFYSILETVFSNVQTWLFWPSREAIRETMPKSFRNYPNCRAIIDCTEIYCDRPSTVEQRVLLYSSYKSTYTVKYLVAISPCGLITFLSKGYGGRSSDSFITNNSGFLNLIEEGDLILADKGFPQIKSEVLQRKCILVMPPFGHNPQFSREEVLEGYSIASVRIHVERAIQRIKIFEILKRVDIETLSYIDKIMYVACVFANNKEPLIADK